MILDTLIESMLQGIYDSLRLKLTPFLALRFSAWFPKCQKRSKTITQKTSSTTKAILPKHTNSGRAHDRGKTSSVKGCLIRSTLAAYMTTYLCLLRSVYYVVHRAYCRFLCFDGPPPPCLLTIKPHFLCAHNIITTMDGYVVVLLYIQFLCFMVRNFWRLREKLNARTKILMKRTNRQSDRHINNNQQSQHGNGIKLRQTTPICRGYMDVVFQIKTKRRPKQLRCGIKFVRPSVKNRQKHITAMHA